MEDFLPLKRPLLRWIYDSEEDTTMDLNYCFSWTNNLLFFYQTHLITETFVGCWWHGMAFNNNCRVSMPTINSFASWLLPPTRTSHQKATTSNIFGDRTWSCKYPFGNSLLIKSCSVFVVYAEIPEQLMPRRQNLNVIPCIWLFGYILTSIPSSTWH